MNKKIIVGAALTFLLASPRAFATQSIEFDSKTAVRVIGTAAALGGIYSICKNKKSTIGGLIMLVAGTSTALGADRITEEFDRHVTKSNFFGRVSRDINHWLNNTAEHINQEL